MRRLSCYIGCMLATLLMVACKSDDPLQPEGGTGDGEPVLEISVDGDFYMDTRSETGAASSGYKLVSSEAVQHIESMYAYIFKGSGEDATCVFVKKLPWETASQPQGAATLNYSLKEVGLDKYGTEDMQVLVIAVDNRSDTYDFPYVAIEGHDSQSMMGRSLNAVKLQLAEKATGTDGGTTETVAEKAYRMANTEVFSGYKVFKASDQVIRVEMMRCVAGVLCYLTDIPYYVNGQDNRDVIQSIELRLGGELNLNTSYSSFYKNYTEGATTLVYAEDPLTDGNVIASVNISEYIYGIGVSGVLDKQAGTSGGETLLYVPEQNNGVVKTLENTILFGAYLLPIQATQAVSEQDATLQLVLKNVEGGELTYYVKNMTSGSHAYSLDPNCIYSIGSKPSSTDTESDRPASLKGKELNLKVVEWGGADNDDDVLFPPYALNSYISASWDENYENYIFDCMNSIQTIYIKLSEEDANNPSFNVWASDKETIDEGEQRTLVDWVDFRFYDDEKKEPIGEWISSSIQMTDNIASQLQGKNQIALQVRLHDYVVYKNIMGSTILSQEEKIKALKEDYRTAYLQLTASDGTTVISSVPVKQFNAITVEFTYDKETYTTAFSRVDLGDTMGDDGVALGNGSQIPWGLDGVYAWILFGSKQNHRLDGNVNGEEDYKKAFDSAKGNNYVGFEDSAIAKAYKEVVMNGVSGKYWYLPAREELYAFVTQVNANSLSGSMNLQNAYYWTCSSVAGRPYRYAYAISSGATSGDKSTEWDKKRTEYFFCRQAVKIPNQ